MPAVSNPAPSALQLGGTRMRYALLTGGRTTHVAGWARLRLLFIVLVGAQAAACPSVSLQHTARPVPVGERALSGAIGVYSFHDEDGEAGSLPLIEVHGRMGLTDRMDGGLKIAALSMVHADLNYALILTDDFVLSIDPTVAVLPVTSSLVSYLWLPVLADVVTTDDLTLTLSARYGYLSVDDIGDNDLGINGSTGLYGAGIGLRYRISERLWLLPEFHVLQSVEDSIDSTTLYTFTLGLGF